MNRKWLCFHYRPWSLKSATYREYGLWEVYYYIMSVGQYFVFHFVIK